MIDSVVFCVIDSVMVGVVGVWFVGYAVFAFGEMHVGKS